jgi:hypothetical protein
MQFGDENTKFFHSMATEHFRKNVIPRLWMTLGEWFMIMKRKVPFLVGI